MDAKENARPSSVKARACCEELLLLLRLTGIDSILGYAAANRRNAEAWESTFRGGEIVLLQAPNNAPQAADHLILEELSPLVLQRARRSINLVLATGDKDFFPLLGKAGAYAADEHVVAHRNVLSHIYRTADAECQLMELGDSWARRAREREYGALPLAN